MNELFLFASSFVFGILFGISILFTIYVQMRKKQELSSDVVNFLSLLKKYDIIYLYDEESESYNKMEIWLNQHQDRLLELKSHSGTNVVDVLLYDDKRFNNDFVKKNGKLVAMKRIELMKKANERNKVADALLAV